MLQCGGSDTLLCRQFVSSFSGIAFDWYAELPNDSVKIFAELEDLFVKWFTGVKHHITIGDHERQKPAETLMDYILRWRNLSMKCEPQLQEQHTIKILLKSIHGPVGFLLEGFTIKTFEKLLSKVGNLQEESKQLEFFEKAGKLKPLKTSEKKSGIIAVVDRGKRPLQIQVEQSRQIYQRPRQNGQQSFQQRSYQTDGGKPPNIKNRLNKMYPFKNEAVKQIFQNLIKKHEFKLPEPKKPDEVDEKYHPMYCPYHRLIGHTIKDCFTFKD
ncbi:uncharacterized protein LOC110032059 [Phalaenopsis equestris]|uniref:uncharacterized protein LOC110032059 n=1 Tax=Phalaenopsis equestris TaxID=78828 RepID=UPI0009E57E0E|nr:uncharacterized protein LOC110032059 [Phalaenopsis equestris]